MSTGDLTESILAIVIYLTTTTKDAPRTEAGPEARFDKSKFDKVEEWQDEIYFSGGYNRTSRVLVAIASKGDKYSVVIIVFF